MSDVHAVARDQLRSIVQRVERLESEIADLNADKSEIYKEARANGFDVKAIKKVVSKRKLDDNERQEQDAIFDTYWDAVHGTNLVHAHTREIIEEFDAETGEFLEEQNTHSGAISTPESAASASSQGAAKGEVARFDLPENTPETATQVRSASTDAPKAPGKQCTSVVSRDEAGQNVTGNPITEPDGDAIDEVKAQSRLSNAVGVEPPPSVTARKTAADYRPHCVRPSNCASGSIHQHCHSCKTAMRELERIKSGRNSRSSCSRLRTRNEFCSVRGSSDDPTVHLRKQSRGATNPTGTHVRHGG